MLGCVCVADLQSALGVSAECRRLFEDVIISYVGELPSFLPAACLRLEGKQTQLTVAAQHSRNQEAEIAAEENFRGGKMKKRADVRQRSLF